MTPQFVMAQVEKLCLLRHFPSQNPTAIAELARKLSQWCAAAPPEDEQRLEWLIDKLLSEYDEWPGPASVKVLYLSRFPIPEGVT